jgi:hypothetical protein
VSSSEIALGRHLSLVGTVHGWAAVAQLLCLGDPQLSRRSPEGRLLHVYKSARHWSTLVEDFELEGVGSVSGEEPDDLAPAVRPLVR